MITLDSILENIFAQIIVLVVSFIVSVFLPKLIKRDTNKTAIVKYDPLSIAIFFEFILIFNLILNLSFWKNSDLTAFFTLVLMLLTILIKYIYDKQCPSCKKFIRAKQRIDDKTIKKFTLGWKYQPMKIWLYSNGNVWKKKPIGKEKTRTENWITKQEFYKCSICEHKWDSGHFDINLDEKTRPQPEEIQTDEKDPNQPY